MAEVLLDRSWQCFIERQLYSFEALVGKLRIVLDTFISACQEEIISFLYYCFARHAVSQCRIETCWLGRTSVARSTRPEYSAVSRDEATTFDRVALLITISLPHH
jgi:hypothetical protein